MLLINSIIIQKMSSIDEKKNEHDRSFVLLTESILQSNNLRNYLRYTQ